MLSAFAAASLGGCSSKKPETQDFRASLAQTVAGYSITDLRCEAFANDSQEGLGRASCRGTLALAENLYSPVSSEEVGRLLIAAGIPSEGGGYFRRRHPRTIYAPAVSAGAETPFSSECSYAGDVDGWQIGCETSFSRHSGQPLGTLGGEFAVTGTPEYEAYIQEVMSDYRRLDAAYREVVSQVEAFFAVGRTVYSPSVRARITRPLVWSGDRGFLGRQGVFSLEQKYQDLRERNTSTFCGYRKGAPADDIRFSGDINFNRSREGEEEFIASVYMMDRVAPQNGFQSCGNRFRWNGSAWVSSFYSQNQLRSQ